MEQTLGHLDALISACFHFFIKGFKRIQNLILATNAIKSQFSEDQSHEMCVCWAAADVGGGRMSPPTVWEHRAVFN